MRGEGRAPVRIRVDRVAVVVLYVVFGVAAAVMARLGGLVGFFASCDDGARCVRGLIDLGIVIVYAAPAVVLLLSVPAAVSRSVRQRAAWWVPLLALAAAAGAVTAGYLLVTGGSS